MNRPGNLAPALHQVVIVGGGFGGLYAAKALRRAPVRLTLIDRRNFHLFQPLLYQVATGGLSPGDITSPLRFVLKRQANTRVLLGDVQRVDVNTRRVILSDGFVSYDTLIVAAGSRHHYFGNDQWEPLAPGLKTIEDATEIRRRVLLAFETAEREPDPALRHAWLTFVVVGGGPTGVELAGALGEIANDTLKSDFRTIRPSDAKILLVEGVDRILPPYPPRLSRVARNSLESLGVTVRTATSVTRIDDESVTLRSDGEEERIAARTVLWAAGVQANGMGKDLAAATGATLDRSGRLIVGPELSLPLHPEILVIGDMAHFAHQNGQPLPAVAPVAMAQGRYVANLLRRRLQGRPAKPFHYFDKGAMATIGRSMAVCDFGWLRFSGLPAWLTWLFVHLLYLVEFENRLLVLVQWAWNYVTFNRGARLITGPNPLPLPLSSTGENGKKDGGC
jgi:NADH dehydrogenase